ncbi:stage II sporulation protein P [Sporosarcina beigongshangi]|uniref:stage II sporulation protein P n=1 Tax=Sporosarcina beigongshangi TaxID=2782538 RepID=UPI00193967BD|nr:stage II sporulation protein P [Sporosarcina beigongshangi]
MSPKIKNYSKKRNRPLLIILLYLAIFLFIIWLVVVLWLEFYFWRNEIEENSLLGRVSSFYSNDLEKLKASPYYFGSLGKPNESINGISNEKEKMKIQLKQPDRDEFEPEMKELLKDRDLTFKNIDAIFENMKSPKRITNDPIHSTFGKDVVYIYHTHNRESFLPYLKGIDKPEDAYHSKANITLVGEMLGRALERRGVGTKVDSTDIVQELSLRGVDYGGSYKLSGDIVRSALVENKNLEIFLDLHRDSLRKDSTTLEMNGENYARLLFVIGTGHEDFARNLSFAEGVDNLLAIQYPGLSKGILKKDSSQGNGVYNQDISPNSVIVEIGGVDNTVEELYRTTEVLADVLSDYYWHGEK